MMRELSILTGILAILCADTAMSRESFEYHLQYLEPGGDRVTVELQLPGIPVGPQVLVMPRAIPMGYTQEPYDRFVMDVSAWSSSGESLPVERGGGPRWIVGAESQTIARIRYEVDIAMMEREILDSSDASKRRSGYLSLLGYSVFAYLEGMQDHPIHLTVEVADDWPAISTLAPRVPPHVGRTTADADDFYALADAQIMAGPDAVISRLDGPVPLYLVLYAEGEVDVPLMTGLIEDSMTAVIDYFGSASTLSSHDFRTLRNVSSRGGMMAAEMDAMIQEKSGGTRTLRDGLQFLMAWSARERRPLKMAELPAILELAVGVDTAPILRKWARPFKN